MSFIVIFKIFEKYIFCTKPCLVKTENVCKIIVYENGDICEILIGPVWNIKISRSSKESFEIYVFGIETPLFNAKRFYTKLLNKVSSIKSVKGC